MTRGEIAFATVPFLVFRQMCCTRIAFSLTGGCWAYHLVM